MTKFTIKPVFIAWSTLVAQLPIQLFLTVWSGGFFGGMFQAFIGKYNPLPFSPFVTIGVLAFVCIPLFVYVTKKLNYEKTEYRFFEDRLEFEEGFFTLNKKVIKYQDVKEVNLRKGVLQRANGLGTVYLATTATGSSPDTNPFSALGFGNTSASGIAVRDVVDPDLQYDKIRALIDAAKV